MIRTTFINTLQAEVRVSRSDSHTAVCKPVCFEEQENKSDNIYAALYQLQYPAVNSFISMIQRVLTRAGN
ncbi:MAG: hypothetical protein BGO31_06860 [Bacteroidetes bacterium 43-16]|nr:MAG: hypothetical protein BGO31_06860 [Bacteroidetes bacterium 43-16]